MTTTKQAKLNAEFIAHAQGILDRAIAAGDQTVVDIYAAEVAIRKAIIAKEN